MKQKIYKIFDGLVMAMMFAAVLNLVVADTNVEYLIMLGLFALGGIWLEVADACRL